MHSISLRLAASLTVLAAAGCSVLPIYTPTPTDARVTVIGIGRVSMCTKGAGYQLEPVTAGKHAIVMVPTGQRVQLTSTMQFSGHQVISTCTPSLAFTPAAGKSYVFNSGLAAGQCFTELVVDDKSTASGVAPEPTLTRPAC